MICNEVKKEGVFRSRGFRYQNRRDKLEMKIYYEPDYKVINSNDYLKDISSKLECFEYSICESGSIDSVNYHTDFKSMECKLPNGEGKFNIEELRSIFDESFRAYTIGYRIVESKVVGRSIYYYPTVWKGNRYGLKGITDVFVIKSQVSRFMKMLDFSQNEKEKLMKFVSLMKKFKGCCITEYSKGEISYKLYGKISDSDLRSYFKHKIDINELNRIYGETVLCSVRIRNKEITGYNLYYLN